jgi:hypothetical protein
MEKLWFFAQGSSSDKQGPVTETQIRALIAERKLLPTDLVWSEGMTNWIPLGRVPELRPEPMAAAAGATSMDVPEGLKGWMTFVAIMTILGGVLQCFGCFTIVIGIPMIIGGIALLAAKDLLPELSSNEAALGTFLLKLKSFFLTSGIVYVISLVLGVIVALLFVFGAAAGMFSALQGH